ncbi:type-IV secretion system protein TraC [Escherichia coli E22]|nr:type-IV secretion system protein TraC [Escherichia coli E22]
MSNNPLDAVTQAVNSLVTALKLPDESAKANEVLGEMSFPQFSRLLPYRDYNQESGLFMNDTTMGFMLEAIPINGANESIVEALDHMLRTKLPRGVPFCIHLMSSQLVGDRIEYGLREFSWSGEQAERFNAITRAYYMNAAATQFPLPEGMNLPLTLRHYRVFFSYCSPSKKKSRADILEMENLVKIIRASLQGASITTQAVDAQAFIDIVGEMINHNPDSLYPKRRQLDPYSDLNYQCVEDSFDLKVRADYLTLGLRENGRNSTARILNFHLARNPEIAFLWNMADNYSNLLNPELSISCPFILTLTLVVEDQVKTHSEANLKYMDLEKKSKTSYAKWFPSVEKEAKEWGELRQRLGSGQSSVVSYFLNITAFCKDNNETALEVEQDILNSFRKNGFELISPRFNHMRNFLTCLPFMAGKGLFKQLKEAGVVQRAESFNVANLMPLVADNPLTPAGLLAPTYRNQLAFIDIFFRGMNNTNYNMAVCGTSGAGKTGLIQPLIRSVLDSGGFAVVFDMGDGYKSLCENMGGVYLDGETLRFNPFANITDIRMFSQIANIMLYCLFIFFWILVGLVLWVKISWQTFVNGCIYWWCTTLEGMRDLIKSQPVYEIQYYGKTFRMNAAQVLHDKYMIWCGEQLWSAFVLATVVALVICLITFFVVSWILGRQGKQQSENEVTGGRQLTDNPKDVARMLKKDGKDSDIRIGDLPIIRDSEIQNFCLHGTVGAGKSEVIRRLANYARQRGDMVVIYDRSTWWKRKLRKRRFPSVLC